MSISVAILFRWLYMLLLAICWPLLIRWWGNKQQWSYTKITFWKMQWGRVVIWAIVFELLINENLLMKFTHLFF